MVGFLVLSICPPNDVKQWRSLSVRFLLVMATAPIMRGRNEAVLWLSGTLAFWPLAIETIVSVSALRPIS